MVSRSNNPDKQTDVSIPRAKKPAGEIWAEKLKPKKDYLDKIEIVMGRITNLENVDAIVNPSNSTLYGAVGVDGAIQKAAGPGLYEENKEKHLKLGEATLSHGYNLPSKYVITVCAPKEEDEKALFDAYRNCFDIVKQNSDIKSVAFPCISTGVNGFPKDKAANTAIQVTEKFLRDNGETIDKVVFCVFSQEDEKMYSDKISKLRPEPMDED